MWSEFYKYIDNWHTLLCVWKNFAGSEKGKVKVKVILVLLPDNETAEITGLWT